jgi:hypothetical protein
MLERPAIREIRKAPVPEMKIRREVLRATETIALRMPTLVGSAFLLRLEKCEVIEGKEFGANSELGNVAVRNE